MIKNCPKCGLINSSIAERCDCSYLFPTNGKDTENKRFDNKVSYENLLRVSALTIVIAFILSTILIVIIDNLIINIVYPHLLIRTLHYLIAAGVIVGADNVSEKAHKMILSSIKNKQVLKNNIFLGRLSATALGFKLVLFLTVMWCLDYAMGITVDDSMAIHYITYLFLIYGIRQFFGLLVLALKDS